MVAACGGGDDIDPSGLETCREVAAAGFDGIKQTVEVVDALSPEELEALAAGTGTPLPQLEEFEATGEVLRQRAAELGCTKAEIDAYFFEHVHEIESDSVFGRAIIEGIEAGGSGLFDG